MGKGITEVSRTVETLSVKAALRRYFPSKCGPVCAVKKELSCPFLTDTLCPCLRIMGAYSNFEEILHSGLRGRRRGRMSQGSGYTQLPCFCVPIISVPNKNADFSGNDIPQKSA